ncbi:protease [Paenibacillus sp. MER TA 81-3]|uniref:protease n=1 Tax=Paenibacillus sp. MER TA 81-3 TaxID=2939573 RepID=UPI00203B814C|nr:protease [Paenibacillus sp. MER TA 81-3]MCM3338849.1 protease [Paenibacillus sp. MER TA 81-3]
MEAIYWGLLVFGALYAIITFIFGEVLSHAFDAFVGDGHLSFLQPTALVSGLTTLGAIGILLTRYTAFQSASIMLIAIAGAILVSVMMYFFYIRPMEQGENSVGFSIQDLTGKVGEVNVPIPAAGFGEVTVRIGAGVTNQIAASFDKEDIPSGTTIVVIEVKEDTLYVSPLTEDLLRPSR